MATFTGADGKQYEVRMNLGVLRRFERRTGKRILKACFGSVRALADKSEEEVTDLLFDGLGQVFESLDDAGRFVYECSVPRKQQADVDFDDFCDDVLDVAALKDAVAAVFTSLAESIGATADAVALTRTSGSDPKTAGG